MIILILIDIGHVKVTNVSFFGVQGVLKHFRHFTYQKLSKHIETLQLPRPLQRR